MSEPEVTLRSSGEPENPFAVSQVEFTAAGEATGMTDAARIRMEHMSAEASVRAIGGLQIFGAVIILLVSAAMVADGGVSGSEPIMLGLSVLGFFIGRGLRNLQNWARITAAVLSLPGIMSPITWIILYYLLNRKAAFVCTPQYAVIRAATPEMKYRTSIIVKFLVCVLILVLLMIIVMLVLA
jgi:hypothetical protein